MRADTLSHTHTYLCTHSYMHTHTHVYTHVHGYTHIHTYVYTHVHRYTHTHMCVNTCTHTHSHTHHALPQLKESEKHAGLTMLPATGPFSATVLLQACDLVTLSGTWAGGGKDGRHPAVARSVLVSLSQVGQAPASPPTALQELSWQRRAVPSPHLQRCPPGFQARILGAILFWRSI